MEYEKLIHVFMGAFIGNIRSSTESLYNKKCPSFIDSIPNTNTQSNNFYHSIKLLVVQLKK